MLPTCQSCKLIASSNPGTSLATLPARADSGASMKQRLGASPALVYVQRASAAALSASTAALATPAQLARSAGAYVSEATAYVATERQALIAAALGWAVWPIVFASRPIKVRCRLHARRHRCTCCCPGCSIRQGVALWLSLQPSEDPALLIEPADMPPAACDHYISAINAAVAGVAHWRFLHEHCLLRRGASRCVN
jgi:hypothetical protein